MASEDMYFDALEDFIGRPIQMQSSSSIAEDLSHAVCRIMGLPADSIKPDTDLRDFAFESVQITELTKWINTTYDVGMNAGRLFEHFSVAALAKFIDGLIEAGAQTPMNPKKETSASSAAVSQNESPDDQDSPYVIDTKDIAVIGMSGEFPGAEDIDIFWANLVAGKDMVADVPASRWDWKAYLGDPHETHNKSYSKWLGSLDDIKGFDATFFRISPREAACMDPQQRLLLEASWHAIENAGYSPRAWAGSDTGVFIGVCNDDYNELMYARNIPFDAHVSTGGAFSIIANRISYFLDLQGPSVAVDTACSSSLVAVHQAVQAIRNRECDQALAGGVNVCVNPKLQIAYAHAGMLSKSGRCRTFDQDADGYVRGEGVGVIALKRLADAIRDRDNIHAVIKGSAVNHGGYANTLTAPNASAQCRLIVKALKNANVPPETISYVEAHGTGTALGDPVEINGLTSALDGADGNPGDLPAGQLRCGIGSVKTNIGHLESAAGIAGLIKTVLCLKHRTLTANCHFKSLNPNIQFSSSRFFIVTECQKWEPGRVSNREPHPRRAGISSFGFGGTNAHVILEEYEKKRSTRFQERVKAPCLIVLSARTHQGLNACAGNLLAHLKHASQRHDTEGSLLRDIAYTLQVGRYPMDARLAVVVTTIDELISMLENHVGGEKAHPSIHVGLVQNTEGSIEMLTEGAEGEIFINALVENRQLHKLGLLWTKGLSIDWQKLYSGESPQRIPLPGYPFNHKPYWFEEGAQSTAPQPPQAAEKPKDAKMRVALDEPAKIRCDRLPAPSKLKLQPMDVPDVSHGALPARDPQQATLVRSGDPSMKEMVRSELAAVLSVDTGDIDDGTPFVEVGLDSILTVELAKRLQNLTGMEFKAARLYDFATVDTLTGYLTRQAVLNTNDVISIDDVKADLPSGPLTSPSLARASGRIRLSPCPEPSSSGAAPEQGSPSVFREASRRAAPAISLTAPEASPFADSTTTPGGGTDTDTDIAVIGMSANAPGASSLDAFWENLKKGVDSVIEVPADRWEINKHYDPDSNATNKSYSKWGGFLDHIDRFDPLFFNISPKEAALMDPQQRLYMQAVWHAIEDGGYAPESLSGSRCGMFVGVGESDYYERMKQSGVDINAVFLFGVSSSVVGARMSYFLNLKGPCVAIDTACSSALTAVNFACKSIQNQDCDIALAGGISVKTLPDLYISASKTGMLSKDGRCKTFDNRANGFVPSEFVGVLFLKRLSAALRDKDHIYGVIKGSMVNQDGATNGLTAPSAESQKELMTHTYRRFGIDPEHIGYVEAHGTGTKLGDPIEVDALTQAFRQHTSKEAYCAIGSVKTNIGHALKASGMPGLIKVLLCLKNSLLVPSLHYQQTNDQINFDGSPFYVNTDLKPWPPLSRGRRKAAISAFGYSGTNCHVVLEEAPARETNSTSADATAVFVPLSAKTGTALARRVNDLEAWLGQRSGEVNLKDVAYSLTIGRSHFRFRTAFVATSRLNLVHQLRAWLARHEAAHAALPAGQSGSVQTDSDQEKEGCHLIRHLSAGQAFEGSDRERLLNQLARLYKQGADLPYADLFEAETCRRIPVPGYPFDEKRFWFNEQPKDAGRSAAPQTGPVIVHPLIDRNNSTFEEISFSKTFTGEEFYLKDHKLGRKMILPGAAYIELARAAGELADERPVSGLKGLVWFRAIEVDRTNDTIHITMKRAADHADFEIFTRAAEGSRIRHAQGRVLYEAVDFDGTHPRIDIQAIKDRCAGRRAVADCYRMWHRKGLSLGPAFQVMQELACGERESLALLKVPESLQWTVGPFVLPTSLVDGAFQSTSGLMSEEEMKAPDLNIPFTLQAVIIRKPLTEICYAHTTLTRRVQTAKGKTSHFDIVLTDADGEMLAQLNGFTHRQFKSEVDRPPVPFDLLYYRPLWRQEPLRADAKQNIDRLLVFERTDGPFSGIHMASPSGGFFAGAVIRVQPGRRFCQHGGDAFELRMGEFEDYQRLFETLNSQNRMPGHIVHGWAETSDGVTSESLDAGLISLFHICRALMIQAPRHHGRLLFFYHNPELQPQPQHDAVGAFLKIVALEHPRICTKTVAFSGTAPTAEACGRKIMEELAAEYGGTEQIRYREGQRWVRRLQEIVTPPQPAAPVSPSPIRQQGVFLITGGLGGIGLIFARYLAARFEARLMLCGRRPIDDAARAQIRSIEAEGGKVQYVQADVTRREDVERLVEACRSAYGPINGILHSAGRVQASRLVNKSEEEMAAVLGPKVFGTANLDAATRTEPLDFFVMFSSIASVWGENIGQCDYAYANGFMDHFAAWRESRRRDGMCSGRTLSINWPFWQDGGMTQDAQTAALLQNTKGVAPMDAEAGLQAFLYGMNLDLPQLMVITGEGDKIRSFFTPPRADDTQTIQGEAMEKEPERSRDPASTRTEAAADAVFDMIARVSEVDKSEIDPDEDLSRYGFDSIRLTELANALNDRYNLELTPTIFFEHSIISEFIDYLAANHAHDLASGQQGPEPADPAATAVEIQPVSIRPDRKPLPGPPANPNGHEPLAIVGMGGIMPQSDDLATFWDHLAAGRDLITEIPPDRWDWRDYQGDPTKEDNKTNSRHGGFMTSVSKFDPRFFGISPKEVEYMDPQHRLFLKVVWQTLEDAGYGPAAIAGTRTGVFVGVATWEYSDLMIANGVEIGSYGSTGTALTVVPNRISYMLDLRGPSEPVNTACSSSLVAVHRAVEAIRSGSCDMAIAGGVNAIVGPKLYVAFGKSGMLSPDGRCKTFSKDADGYVRGEGVGAILIKRLGQAESDGDHIYGVIRGSAVSHGGKTKSLTAPNPAAQADLLVDAWEDAGVDPRTISYIEAHGTGTSLGDPVEIEGLKSAFKRLEGQMGSSPVDAPRCGIGSVKTNIGHLETAAGIAGIIKVLLAMKHNTLPPSINFSELNPYIRLENTPFYICQQAQPWAAPIDHQGHPLPRRAGVSSFGYGGVYAHILLEQHDAGPDIGRKDDEAQLVVLSALSRERLAAYARTLLHHLKNSEDPIRLIDLAYTLQVGRKPQPARLALTATDLDDLEQKLDGFIRQPSMTDGCCHGIVRKRYGHDKQGNQQARERVDAALQKNDLDGLGRLWVDGAAIDWASLHAGRVPRRISLPTYPFEEKHYWIPEARAKNPLFRTDAPGVSAPEPLLRRSSHDFEGLCFTTRLKEGQVLANDHEVRGRRIIPAAGYLEMARAAGEMAGGQSVPKLKNIVWVSPMEVQGDNFTVDVRLSSGGAEETFEIVSRRSDGTLQVHCQGKLSHQAAAPVPPEDLDAIRARCRHLMDGSQWYDAYREVGMNYGPGFRVVQEIYFSATESLSRIVLPAVTAGRHSDQGLDPSLLDGALQTVRGLTLGGASAERLQLPFTLSELNINGSVSESCYAYAIPSPGQDMSHGRPSKYDVRLLDEKGNVLVALHRLTPRSPAEEKRSASAVTQCYTVGWQPSPGGSPAAIAMPETVVIFDDTPDLADALRQRIAAESGPPGTTVLVTPGRAFTAVNLETVTINPAESADYGRLLDHLRAAGLSPNAVVFNWSTSDADSGPEDVDQVLIRSIGAVTHTAQALIAASMHASACLIYLGSESVDGPQPEHAALGGLFRSLRQEYADLIGKVLLDGASGPPDPTRQADLLIREFATDADPDPEVRYDAEHRQIKRLVPLADSSPGSTDIPLREKGVYLISGGTGDLGMTFARYLASHYKARLALVQRRTVSGRSQEIAALEEIGAEVMLVQADVSDRREAAGAIDAVTARFGPINGVLHAAGVRRDALLPDRDPAAAAEVLGPKVYGTRHLDELTQGHPLDFFVLFSSTSAIFGNRGQSTYAFANGYMDGYAYGRAMRRKQGRCAGQTLSINWPVWKDAGKPLDVQALKQLASVKGVHPLETQDGLRAFEHGMAASGHQMVVVCGDQEKRLRLLRFPGRRSALAGAVVPGRTVHDRLLKKTRASLVAEVAQQLDIPKAEIHPEDEMAEYGFDSFGFTALANRLNEVFNLELTPTVFFDNPTIEALAEYFTSEFGDRLGRHFGIQVPLAAGSTIASPETEQPPEAPADRENAPRPVPVVQPHSLPVQRGFDMAVVGMSGILPQSDDLTEFWQHLAAGRDLVTEIPEDRWNGEAFYGDPAETPNVSNSKWGGFIGRVDRFDPLFFGISDREARLMDPQQRLFLQVVWHCVEDAGYRMSDLSGTDVGLFVGVSSSDYGDIVRGSGRDIEAYTATGSAHSILANRISYLFNLKGPSEPVNTACSSSLVAIHRAVEALAAGSCDMAIAGGVNLLLSPKMYIAFAHAGMLSSTGRCRTFSKDADGYVRGEGVGAILIKPLAQALADGDHIHGIIRSSMVNHGGRANSLTAPNPGAQADLIQRCWKRGGIDPLSISYIEAHGTGTVLGDPIEVDGLKKAYALEGVSFTGEEKRTGFCGLGTVKSNIGHLEAAAGIAGVIKVLLAMRHGQLPPSLHCDKLNPYLKLENSPFFVVRQLQNWTPSADRHGRVAPLRAGVSSFGFGGTNAHIILEAAAAPTENPVPPLKSGQIVILSARDEERLKAYARSLMAFVSPDRPQKAEGPGEATELIKELTELAADILSVPAGSIDPEEDLLALGMDQLALHLFFEAVYRQHGKKLTTSDASAAGLSIQTLTARLRRNSTDGAPHAGGRSVVGEMPLAQLAYTLQTGREAMGTRLALVVTDWESLIEGLSAYIDGETDIDGLFTGAVANRPDAAPFLIKGKAGQAYLRTAVSEGDLESLAQMWVWGVDIDWRLLYGENPPPRVPLPTYPFAQERYWVESQSSEQRAPSASREDEVNTPAATEPSVPQTGKVAARPEGSDQTTKENDIGARLLTDLTMLVSEIAHMDITRIDLDAELGHLGFDSIILTELTRRFNKTYGLSVMPSIFAAHPSIRSFALYAQDTHGEDMRTYYRGCN